VLADQALERLYQDLEQCPHPVVFLSADDPLVQIELLERYNQLILSSH
jgi:hypothetical protein